VTRGRWCALLTLLVTGCGDAKAGSSARETLPDGTVVLSYDHLDGAPVDTLAFSLVLGQADGEEWETFGRIGGLGVGGDGSIYVLDAQALSVRIFDHGGSYRGTVGRRGEGPGELRRPTGLIVTRAGTLWIRDQGARHLMALSEEGDEIGRYPLPTSGSGSSAWDAVVDGDGRIWQSWTHTLDGSQAGASEPALLEWTQRQHVRSLDPRSGAADSLVTAETTVRVLYAPLPPSGFAMGLVPFDPRALVALDEDATVWAASSGEYRITRTAENGNPTPPLIIRVAVDAPAASQEQRSAWQSALERTQIDLDVPQRQQPLVQLLTDDRRHVWVQRSVGEGEPAHFDAFTRDGELLGTVRVAANLAASPAPVVRGGYFYAVAAGDLDIQQVVMARLPAFAR
jgi:hypothetical protein